MNVLFIILKIIGILLLVILLLALLILFHPAYYKINAEIEEEVSIKGHVWWLFHILRLEFEIEDSRQEVWLRIFGHKKELQPGAEDETAPEDEGDGQSAEHDDAKSAEQSQTAESDSAKSTEQSQTAKYDGVRLVEQSPTEKCGVEAAGQTVREDKSRKKKTQHRESDTENRRNKPGKEDKLSKWKSKYRNFTTFAKFLKKEISDERNRKAVSHIWQEFLYLLKHLKPKYMKGDISFSTGDPAATGEVTGALSLLPVIYRYDVQIYPDFLSEEMYVRGSLALKGHMALFHVIAIVIRGIKDKNIKRLAGKIRRFSNGR